MLSTLLAEIVGFLIVVFVIYRYVLPPLRRLVEKREETIRQQVEAAKEAEQRKKDAHAEYDHAVERAENDAARIRDDARADADRIQTEGRERAREEAERIKKRGDEALENSRLQATRELKGEVGGHATTLADRLVREELEDDSAQQASIDAFLGDIERMAPGAPEKSAVGSS